MIHTAIVSDCPLVREGLRSLISRTDGMRVCAEVDHSASSLQSLEECSADVCVIAMAHDVGSGLELIRRLDQRNHAMRCLIWSMCDGAMYAERALRAGARGWFNGRHSSTDLLTAIRKVHSGGVSLPDQLADYLLDRTIGSKSQCNGSALEGLSDRELEVFRLLGSGLDMASIASRLHVSRKTAETYRQRIRMKMRLANSRQVDFEAVRWNMEGETAAFAARPECSASN
ncbi:MAG: response regulator [Planctomycetales bacterium]